MYQSLCDGKVKGLTEVLAGPVCKAGLTELTILKLSWMPIFEEPLFEAVCKAGAPGLLHWCLVLLVWNI